MSRSIRKETSSLAFGMVGRFGGSSAGFVVAALNAASAASREVVVLRVLSAGILCPRPRASLSYTQTGYGEDEEDHAGRAMGTGYRKLWGGVSVALEFCNFNQRESRQKEVLGLKAEQKAHCEQMFFSLSPIALKQTMLCPINYRES